MSRRAARAWGSARTRCGIRSRRICSSAARICARFRSSSATRGSARRSAIRTSMRRSSSRSTASRILARTGIRGLAVHQPPLLALDRGELTVAIGGLAIGGAERIVIDWAARVRAAWPVHIIVLRDHAHEWAVPPGIRVTRLGGADLDAKLTRIGRELAQRGSPVVLCHLLIESERRPLAAAGADVVPVIHNARAGWLERAAALHGHRHAIAVSEAAAADLRRDGFGASISIVRHIPRPRRFARDARASLRRAWRIPEHATVAGMIGAVKPQKDYPFAIRLLKRVLADRDLYLVIAGGPVGKHG